MLNLRPRDIAAPRIPHLEERLAFVAMPFRDHHHLDRSAAPLRNAAAARGRSALRGCGATLTRRRRLTGQLCARGGGDKQPANTDDH
jgi:hypothetical protein